MGATSDSGTDGESTRVTTVSSDDALLDGLLELASRNATTKATAIMAATATETLSRPGAAECRRGRAPDSEHDKEQHQKPYSGTRDNRHFVTQMQPKGLWLSPRP